VDKYINLLSPLIDLVDKYINLLSPVLDLVDKYINLLSPLVDFGLTLCTVVLYIPKHYK
jgi:hypothetical protein